MQQTPELQIVPGYRIIRLQYATQADPDWASGVLNMPRRAYLLLLPKITDWMYISSDSGEIIAMIVTEGPTVLRYMFVCEEEFVNLHRSLLYNLFLIYGTWSIDVKDSDRYLRNVLVHHPSEVVAFQWRCYKSHQ
jgi:hypothetical protein